MAALCFRYAVRTRHERNPSAPAGALCSPDCLRPSGPLSSPAGRAPRATLWWSSPAFPEKLTTRYEAEFEKAHPDLHVQFVWKQSRDALALLSQPDQGGVDVYWAPSLGNFPILRDAASSARWRSIAPLCRAGSASSRSPTRRACSRPMTSRAMGSYDPTALAPSASRSRALERSRRAGARRPHRHAARRQGRLLAGALRHHPAGRGVGARLGAARGDRRRRRLSGSVPARPAR